MRVRAGTIIALACLLPSFASAQHVRFGILGGASLTNGMKPHIESHSAALDPRFGQYTLNVLDSSGPYDPILGPVIEFLLPRNFSVEVNALYRKLRSTQTVTATFSDGSVQTHVDSIDRAKTWQLPVLLKYSFPSKRFSPYIEGGPTFRVWQEPSAMEPSKVGATAGVGADFIFGRFKAGPVIRYTRWKADGEFPRRSTKPDQLELLGSITCETSPGTRRIGDRKLWIGVLGGFAPTNSFKQWAYFAPIEEKIRWVAGLSLETALDKRISLEVNGIYRPLYGRIVYESPGFRTDRVPFMVITWQFPVLAKYRFTDSKYAPFFAAGPSFRLAGNKNGYEPSHFGVTGGAGIEIKAGNFRLAPTLRYTYWQAGARRFAETHPNQVEALIALSF